MSRRTKQPWNKRQQIPDAQVRDAADQYDDARQLLDALPIGTGVVLPLLNTAAVAVELYLKSLGSQTIHRPEAGFPAVSRVYAAPEVKRHMLDELLDAIPDDIRRQLEDEFMAERPTGDALKLREVLQTYENLFVASRYPFEEGMDITQYPLPQLMRLCEFLRDFVTRLPPVNRIHWT